MGNPWTAVFTSVFGTGPVASPTTNIHVGLSAWASGVFTAGQRVSTGGSAYQCTYPGSSTAAPTGFSGSINNGGVAIWRWLSLIDYTSVPAWVAGLPSVFADFYVGQIWNNGPITTTAGTPFFNISGHTTTGFTATLRPAPGEGIQDSVRDNNRPLTFNSALGVSFICPATAASNTNYISVGDNNIILDGLQFQDPTINSGSTPLNLIGDNVILRNCVVDGFSQGGGANIVTVNSGITTLLITNCLFVDRQTVAANSGIVISTYNTGTTNHRIVNCTIVYAALGNGFGAGIVTRCGNTSGSVIKNCAIFGWTLPCTNATVANIIADHLVSDVTGITVFTDGGSNLTSKVASSQFTSVTADYRTKRTGDVVGSAVVDTTDIPTSRDLGGRGRPATGTWDSGAWQFSTDTPALPSLSVWRPQEQPSSVTPRLYGSSLSPAAPVVGLGRVVISPQREQPSTSHPISWMRSGPPSRNVAPPVTSTVFVGQQMPWHPGSSLRPGVQGPDVGGPVTRSVLVRQETTTPIQPVMLAGPPASFSTPPTTRVIVIRQEQPGHPLPQFGWSAAGVNVRPPGTDWVLVRQEQTPPIQPVMATGPYGQRQNPPVRSYVVTVQEQPRHPLPALSAGVQGPDAAPPGTIGKVVVRQEQPFHPLPVLSFRRPDPPPPPSPLGVAILPRLPDPIQYLQPVMLAGPQGSSVRSPVTDAAVTRQQHPDWLQPILLSGPYGQNVRSPVSDTVLVRQQQPDHPLPQLRAGPPGPSVRSPGSDTVLLRQEQPWHPFPQMRPGPPGPSVITKVADSVMVRQEQPGHPPPQMRAGVQGPDVITKVMDSAITRQEQPWHPLPQLRPGPPGPNVSLVAGVVMQTRLEVPPYQPAVLQNGVQITTFLSAVTRVYTGRQEQPGHPPPQMVAGVVSNRPFVTGRLLSIRADL